MDSKLKEVALVFFKLGCFAFGGPAAHIAMMEDEVVTKRKWMTRDYFLDLIGTTNLIPGPNSTEMTMHCGYERAGNKGLFVAGLAFILPAITITALLAYLYVKYGELPEVAPFIFGIKPAVLAIIAVAVIKLGKKAVKSKELAVLGVLVLIVTLLGVNEITALLGAGVLGMLYFYIKEKKISSLNSFSPMLFSSGIGAVLANLSTLKVFLVFLKSWCYFIWKRLCAFCLFRCRVSNNRFVNKSRINRCYCSWAVYTWTSIIDFYFYRLSTFRI